MGANGKGGIVNGHFCYNCLKNVDDSKPSELNKRKTASCISCGHIKEGIDSRAMIGDWLVLGKTSGGSNGQN